MEQQTTEQSKSTEAQQVKPSETGQTKQLTYSNEIIKRYVWFAVTTFIIIALAIIFLFLRNDLSIDYGDYGIKENTGPTVNTNPVDTASENGVIENNIVEKEKSDVARIFSGEIPVPSELNMTLSQYIERYLYGCYYIESNNQRIDCYEVYYFNSENPVKEQYDKCGVQDSNQNPGEDCMDVVYAALGTYIGDIACEKIQNPQSRQTCIETSE